MQTYYIYITTNAGRRVFYTGFTTNLKRRMEEHDERSGSPTSFASKYSCKYLLYYEVYPQRETAIQREKKIKKYSRARKLEIIQEFNPDLEFLDFQALT